MNKVILVGRLTKDPELKRTSNDLAVARFTVAITRTYQSKNGEKQADFINCIAWRAQAENLAKFMRKGSLVGIDGSIQTSSFDDQNGVRRFVTEVLCDNIQFLETKGSRNDGQQGYSDINQYDVPDYGKGFNNQSYNNQSQEQAKPRNPFEDIKNEFDISNDDLPF